MIVRPFSGRERQLSIYARALVPFPHWLDSSRNKPSDTCASRTQAILLSLEAAVHAGSYERIRNAKLPLYLRFHHAPHGLGEGKGSVRGSSLGHHDRLGDRANVRTFGDAQNVGRGCYTDRAGAVFTNRFEDAGISEDAIEVRSGHRSPGDYSCCES